MNDFLKENFGQGFGLSTGISGSLAGAKASASFGSDLLHGPNASGEIGNIDPDFARGVNRVAKALGLDEPYSEEDIDLMEQMAGWGYTVGRGSVDYTFSTTPKTTSVEPYSHYYAGAGGIGATVSIPHNSPGFEYTLHFGPQLGLRLGNTTIRGSYALRNPKNFLAETGKAKALELSLPDEPYDGEPVTITGIPKGAALSAGSTNQNQQGRQPRAGMRAAMPRFDYTSPETMASAAKARALNVDTSQINLGRNLIADRPNEALVTLGDWSPFGRASNKAPAAANTAPTTPTGPSVEQWAGVQRSIDADATKARQTAEKQSTLGNAESSTTASTLKAEEKETLSPIGSARTVEVAGVDKLGENAISNASANQEAAITAAQETLEGYPSQAASRASVSRARARTRATDAESSQADREGASSPATDNSKGYTGTDNSSTGSTVTGAGNLKQRTRGMAPTNDGSKGANDTRVICTELVRQGLMAPRLQRLDIAFTLQHLSPATVRGYHAWAVPYVR